MTIEQRKTALINWIANLEDEQMLEQIEGLRKPKPEDLPKAITELLERSDAESADDASAHTSVWDILKKP